LNARIEKPKSSVLVPLLILAAFLLLIGAWQMWGEPAKLRMAKRAIEAVGDACHTGNAQEVAYRRVEAERAIRELSDADDILMSDTALDNELYSYSCKRVK
jgi:hypothetical protein